MIRCEISSSRSPEVDKFDFLTPEFVKRHCIPCGIRCNRAVFPWKYLGWTDEAFMAEEIRFAHGGIVPKEYQATLLGVVRAQEKQLIERHEYVTARDAALKPIHETKSPQGEQLELF